MHKAIEIENIEGMRSREGIEDVALREGIRGLRVGDHVKLTLLTGAQLAYGETLLVRVTRINGDAFRGKLVTRPVSPGLTHLDVGWALSFTAAHIHSLAQRLPAYEP